MNTEKEKAYLDQIAGLEKELKRTHHKIKKDSYGLHWLDVPEAFEDDVENKLPILKEVKDKAILNDDGKPTHILIEGDNYHALTCLNYTHKGKIDVIYIDPPYNTGETKGREIFKYRDKRIIDKYPDGTPVPKDSSFRHSYWLSFMYKRLQTAKELLSDTGVAIIHMDENELYNLGLLLANSVFGERNDLGIMIWNKLNPKGDARGVATMHEYILCYAKNKNAFLELDNTLNRPKPNAVRIIEKANKLFTKICKRDIPDEIKDIIKPFGYSKDIVEDFIVEYDLKLVNKEFQAWLDRQNFSGGEKAYKYIDNDGKVFRSVSMAWPNKSKAPDEYFIPLKHPITGKDCPVPKRGWRNPPDTMLKLLENGDLEVYPDGKICKGEILFGKDETKQPERKYILKNNMFENTPSIFSSGSSDDTFFEALGIEFPYAKPVDVAMYLIDVVHPNPTIILDFFAGSGTTGHAVMALNERDKRSRQYILVTNDENDICTDVCYPRLEYVKNGYKNNKTNFKLNGIGNSLKYYKTEFVGDHNILGTNDQDKSELAHHAGEMLAIAENTLYEMEDLQNDFYQFFQNENQYTAVYFREELDHFEEFREKVLALTKPVAVYVFSWGENEFAIQFEDWNNIEVKPIPQPILEVYKTIYNLSD